MDVSENSGTPKSSISIRFSMINHPFFGSPIFGKAHIYLEPKWGLLTLFWKEKTFKNRGHLGSR